jgi:hypothetical protein
MSFIEVILVAPPKNEELCANCHIVSEYDVAWSHAQWLVIGDLKPEFTVLPWSRMAELEGRAPVAVRVNPLWRGKWEVKAYLVSHCDEHGLERKFPNVRRGFFVEIEILDAPDGVMPPAEPKPPFVIRTPQSQEERWRLDWPD